MINDQWFTNVHLSNISIAVHTTAVSLQLGAGIDRHFACGTVEILFFGALGLLSLLPLLLTSSWAPLRVRVWSWTGLTGHRMTVWRQIRELSAGGDLCRQLRGAERRRVWGWRLWGRGGCHRAHNVAVFWLPLRWLRRSAWACGALNKHTIVLWVHLYAFGDHMKRV